MGKRIFWIDIAKGITILLVVIGHLNIKWFPVLTPIIKEIYTFHMPLFFILSGLTFKFDEKSNFKEFFIKKFKTLIIPYFAFSFIIFIKPIGKIGIDLIKNNVCDFANLFKTLYDVFIMGNGFWFLPCLFLSECLIYCFFVVTKNNKKKLTYITILLSFIAFIYSKYININLPMKLNYVVTASTFILIGYFIKETDFLNNKNNKIFFTISIIAHFCSNILILKIFNITIDIGTIPSYTLYFISTISGSLSIIYLSIFISKNESLQYLGRNSLLIYIFNDIVLKFYKAIIIIVLKIDISNANTNIQFILAIAVIILTIITLIPIIIIVNKYFYYLIGKKCDTLKTKKRSLKCIKNNYR